ncbi:hypothetical protein ACEXQD_02065 [Herbiconiux sp. P15]|uniref:hypothetical protein n=1 Tax=Herbiconiux liukaitaii TaxID=3342799 RepID=UPI0035B906EC
MNDADANLSRHVTEALNASMPDVVKAAGRGRVASMLLLGGVAGAIVVGIGSAIFSSTLATSSVFLVVVLALFVIIVLLMIAALVVGVRAKRAFTRIAEAVRAEHRATLLRVVGRQVHVRP